VWSGITFALVFGLGYSIHEMKEFLEQVREGQRCQVRNCKIGVGIRCDCWELREALQNGTTKVERNASVTQKGPPRDCTGCEHYSDEEVALFYNNEGELTGYDFPYTDPDQTICFTLVASLVDYGMDVNELFIGTSTHRGEGRWQDLADDFNSLVQKAARANRGFFPPEKIMVEGKPYEVFAVCECKQYDCVSNSGEINIQPLPMVKR